MPKDCLKLYRFIFEIAHGEIKEEQPAFRLILVPGQELTKRLHIGAFYDFDKVYK
jgi:hypothetical protein